MRVIYKRQKMENALHKKEVRKKKRKMSKGINDRRKNLRSSETNQIID